MDLRYLLAIVFVVLLAAPISVQAQFTFASDNAGNYGGTWSGNGGSGFNAWSFNNGANSGQFIGNPANNGMGTTGIGTTAFGVFGTQNGQYYNATRSLSAGLGIGDSFTFWWAMNFDTGASGLNKGIEFRSGSTNIFSINNSGTNSAITVNGVNTGFGYGTNPMFVTLTRTATGYNFSMSPGRDGSGSYSATISSNVTINGFNIYGSGNDSLGGRNVYYNNFANTNSGVFSQGGTVTNANTFSGSGALSIGNNTTLVLSGGNNNNYTGATTISNGSTLLFAGSGTSQFASTIGGGTGNVVMSNASGTVAISSNNTYSGNTTIAAGTLLIGHANALGSTGTISVNTGGRLQLSNGITFTRGITLTNDGISGSGALQSVSGNNTWSGNITNNGGSAGGARINADSGSTLTIGGNITSSANTLYIGGAGNMNISGAISGTATTGNGALYKDGTGTLTLSGSNDFSGGTTVSAGAVMAGNNWALGSTNGSTTVSLGAALQLSNVTLTNEAISVTGTGVGSAGALVGYSGNNISLGLLTLSGNNVNTYVGAASGATLTLSNISGGNNELWVVGDGNTTIAGGATSSGATALVKTNTGTLVLASSNAWSGNEYIRQGTVVLSNNNALGTAGTTYLGADGGTAAAALVLGGGIVNSNTVDVVANGTGVRTLGYQTTSGTASQLGGITLNSSSLAFNVTNGGTVLFGGGVAASAGVNDTNRLALDGGGTLIVTNSGSGIASTDRYQVRIGNGTMIIGSGSIVARTNTSGIGHSIDLGVSLDGTQVSQAASLYASNGVTISNSIYVETTLGDAARVIGVRGQGAGATFSGPIALADSVLTLDSTNGANLNVTGAITNFSGTNAVVKAGTGTATLSGANTYNGATTVAGGTLRISGNNRLGNTSTALTISNAGVLEVTSAGTLTNSITIGLGNGALSNSSGGALVIAGGVGKDGTVFTSRSGSGTNVFTGVISGASANSDFVVDGGTTVFSNSMTYNGPTIITNGGTLVLGANNAVPTSSGLVLGGGTFIVGNSATRYSQQLGTLTLTENSTIDLGSYSAGSVLQLIFADSSAITWTSGRTLTITNWQGVAQQSSSVAEIIFGTGGLTSTQLGQIYFANQNINGGQLIGGELVPVPEPRVYAAAVALLAVVGWRERKRLLGLFSREKRPAA